ncbi:glutathione-disulfide reductase [Rhizobacter sp. Root404]|uniref:glutathione-disulfide reductase n=1 Tax=Rhizobacter sp. Root404 TaxID=1736528 RepID=UPI0006F87282|nr:glutathione-disulfide reductase [Rhizobacter sp. Root404]KQW35987.1 glutathione reductase [Rhizobacter sp. Root404]
MTSEAFDLFVIGAGSGGVRAARMAAQRGARVAVADDKPLGGTCVNLGCIPKKLYSFAAHYAEAFEEAHGYGWSASTPVLDWAQLKANRAREISRLNGIYESLLDGAGVQVLRGRARVVGPGEVEIAGQRIRARHILVATGGHPVVPPVSGAELAITSNEIFDLPTFPQHLLVVGGGYIACEFASIFRGLGAQVTQLYRGTQVLRGFDADISAFVADEMRKKGIDLRTGSDVEGIARDAATGRLRVALRDGSVQLADQVLYATGRVPNTRGLGLAEAGVALAPNGAVLVDDQYATNVAGLHAVGDVIDRIHLTPVALAEAMALVDHLFGAKQRAVDYAMIPTAVFTHPSVGAVGLTEAQARAQGRAVRIFRSEFKALKHTLSGNTERTLMKLVVDADTDRVVGLHMVGADAGETIQGFAVALKAGATKAVFDATIGIHPTAAEEFVTMREPVA